MFGLAAVAAWWNPSGSAERELALREFMDLWPGMIPLYVCPPARPGLNYAPIWQKERILNQAIAALPDEVTKIIWCDADVLVRAPRPFTWAANVADALDQYPVVQPWEFAKLQGPDGNLGGEGPLGRPVVESVAHWNQTSLAMPCGLPADCWPGFAWAARRDVLREIGGLYEADLSGPNDVLMSLAFYGDFQNPFLLRYGDRFRRHFMQWGERAHKIVDGQVGFVPATLTHLWHGPFNGRRYLERTVRLYQAGYDPAQHLVTAPDGSLALSADCPWEIRRLAAACVGVDLGSTVAGLVPEPATGAEFGCCGRPANLTIG